MQACWVTLSRQTHSKPHSNIYFQHLFPPSISTIYFHHLFPHSPTSPAPIEIRTRVSGFKDLSDNHYTIGATNANIPKNINVGQVAQMTSGKKIEIDKTNDKTNDKTVTCHDKIHDKTVV